MTVLDVVLLIIIGVWAIGSVAFLIHQKRSGKTCCGSCAGCKKCHK